MDIGVPMEITADPNRDKSNQFYTYRSTIEISNEIYDTLSVWSTISYSDAANSGTMRLIVRDVPYGVNTAPVMTSFSMFPEYNTGEVYQNNFSVWIRLNGTYESIQFTIDSIGRPEELVPDNDGDGVAD